jgi:hypothetical protein
MTPKTRKSRAPKGVEHSCPELPRALRIRRERLGDGWATRIVFGVGTMPGTAPAPPIDPYTRDFTRKGPARKTIDVDVPVASVRLLARHAATRGRAVAVWTYPIEAETWSFYGAWVWTEGERPEVVSAASFAEVVSADPSGTATP